MLSHAAGDTGVPSDRATLWQRYRELRDEAPSGHIAVDVRRDHTRWPRRRRHAFRDS